MNNKNSFASPTPVIDGDVIYLHFGAYGTACITQSGEIVWKTKLEYDNGQHGPGGSPIIYEDLLIVSCDGLDVQFVVGLDKATGKVRWKKTREGYQAYTTPLVVKLPDGDQVIAPGRKLQHLATNQLDGPTLASMAVSHSSLFIRSATHLYRISNPIP